MLNMPPWYILRRVQGAAPAILALVLALAAGRVHAQTGKLGCPCMGTLPDTIARVDCDVGHAANRQCVVADGLLPSPLLAANFGEGCGLHKEPFNPDCFDQQTGRELTAESGERAAWCDQPWCYVDRANCDGVWELSHYWSGGTLAYSFEACDGTDLFSVPESAVLSSFGRRVHESVGIFMATPIQALSFISGLIRTQAAASDGARLAALLYSFVRSD